MIFKLVLGTSFNAFKMSFIRYYGSPIFSENHLKRLEETWSEDGKITVKCEACYHVILGEDTSLEVFKEKHGEKLKWLLSKPIGQNFFGQSPNLVVEDSERQNLIEIGPRLTFTTAFSTNAVSACKSAGILEIIRLERSIRYLITVQNGPLGLEKKRKILHSIHDRMTECQYEKQPESFDLDLKPGAVFEIEVFKENGLEKANKELGLALDDWDLEYYNDLFQNKIKRNPTDVELFDLAQSNSEHCRHWFFKGKMVLDGIEEEESLFEMIMNSQKHSNSNNVIKFCDNSSGIQGFDVDCLISENPALHSELIIEGEKRHIIYTAETHNFPTGVCPFPGATTGTGGRIRDVHATGRGAHEIAGIAGYSFGNLNIPGYQLPWEEEMEYPGNFALPREIAIQASNGASDYGNKFGEPVLAGFARSFGFKTSADDRLEYIKPIMFSGGLGTIDNDQLKKEKPDKDMLVVKMGGPVYRIGVGGGSASSVEIQGDTNRVNELDYGAVQRGDPEMEQKLHRAIRGCVELGPNNPILSIHDQGAGGNGNVIKELVEGAGAVIECDQFELGDPTLSVRELWGAEYQESSAALISAADRNTVTAICARERCPVNFVGTVTGDNKIVLNDFSKRKSDKQPVDLNLEWILGSMPQKVYQLSSKHANNFDLKLPPNLTVKQALERVLRLPSVASKRYLTNKVDRSVTGLVAQQQCVGPLHTPAADVGVIALTFFDKKGAAVAIGEQPIKGLINAACGARMSVGESLTNLVFALITDLKDVKCSGNWMWPAKLPHEGAELVKACKAMCAVMQQLGIAVDGGKDSLSMAAKVGDQVVKSPGTLVISSYAPCPDVTKVVTPDLKCPDKKGTLIYVRFGNDTVCPWNKQGLTAKHRLGGSALAQCYKQIGSHAPDLDHPIAFDAAFRLTQQLISDDVITSGHDVSDGGLITCILEMAFAGNCSINVDINLSIDPIQLLFAEELGIVIEVADIESKLVLEKYEKEGVFAMQIGNSLPIYGPDAKIEISVSGTCVLQDSLVNLRSIWEETSFQLEKLQTDPHCAEQEQKFIETFKELPWKLSFPYGKDNIENANISNGYLRNPPSVAIIREEGSNGDREMAAAFHMAGFQVFDVCMQDFLNNHSKLSLDQFRGVAFVGGFSYADVLGSAKGWASAILFHPEIKREFEMFLNRPDTFSLGVCNGCQLMALLGWIGNTGITDNTKMSQNVLLEPNDCERFHSYFNTVKIESSPALMLRDMEDTVMGVWVSHGEGKFVYSNPEVLTGLETNHLIPLRYVNQQGLPAGTYPENPNGSQAAVAGLCSPDGRHLAMMPHPERCFVTWQWPYWPRNWTKPTENCKSPWMKMFDNAYDWCLTKDA